MDFSLISGALTSLGASIGLAKTALEVRDFNSAGAAIAETTQKLIDLQAQVITLQGSFLQLQQQHSAVTQEVRELKEHRADRERYSLFEISPGGFVYRLNIRSQQAGAVDPVQVEPLHYLCQPCLDVRHVKVVLREHMVSWQCSECKATVSNGKSVLDFEVESDGPYRPRGF